DLFRVEAESQTALLTSGLLQLERGQCNPEQLEVLMRAAHSLKGAARIINLEPAVQVAHAMEDCFVAAQTGKLRLNQPQIDALLRGVDLLAHLSREADPHTLQASQANEVRLVLVSLKNLHSVNAGTDAPQDQPLTHPLGDAKAQHKQSGLLPIPIATGAETALETIAPARQEVSERVVRLTAENL